MLDNAEHIKFVHGLFFVVKPFNVAFVQFRRQVQIALPNENLNMARESILFLNWLYCEKI